MKPEKLDKTFDPRFCSYKLDGETRNQVEKLLNSEDVEESTKEILKSLLVEDEANKNTISYDSLTKLHKYMQRADHSFVDTPFWVFQNRCKCIRPKPRENKELEKRLQKLRLSESQHWYKSTISSVDRVTKNDSIDGNGNIKEDLRVFDGSLAALINSFLVYICTFIFCYKAMEYALPQPNITGQVLFGLFGSTIVAVAELYFLLRVV